MFRKLFPIILLLLQCFSFCEVYSQNDNAAIYSIEHKEQLQRFKKNADEFCAKNLNRFGLDQLQRYDATFDTLFKNELNDTLASFQKIHVESHDNKDALLDSLSRHLNSLNEKRDNDESQFNHSLQKYAITFIIWLAFVFIIMQIRNRTLKRAETKLGESVLQLKSSNEKLNNGEKLFQLAINNNDRIERTQNLADETTLLFKELFDDGLPILNNKEDLKTVDGKLFSIAVGSSRNNRMCKTILSQKENYVEEKILSSLNQLCEKCSDLAFSGMQKADGSFTCTIIKDLEKNLPQIKLIPDAVTALLLNVLSNAFYAVNEKQKRGIKGYLPKVTVSTRVLPRFLQVRIKDNGDGMNDDIISRISEPFFSTKNPKDGAGLGMYFSKQIVNELHEGEIKIESEKDIGSDVYLKFFTS